VIKYMALEAMVILPSYVSAFFTAIRNLEANETKACKRQRVTKTRFIVHAINHIAGRYYARRNVFAYLQLLNSDVGY